MGFNEWHGVISISIDLNTISESDAMSQMQDIKNDISSWYQDNAKRLVQNAMSDSAFNKLESEIHRSPTEDNIVWKSIYNAITYQKFDELSCCLNVNAIFVKSSGLRLILIKRIDGLWYSLNSYGTNVRSPAYAYCNSNVTIVSVTDNDGRCTLFQYNPDKDLFEREIPSPMSID